VADLATLWIGGKLGPIECASLGSFLRHGDKVTVYAMQPISNLPEGVVCRDAFEVLPLKEVLLHKKTRSPALHADLFRYALLSCTDQTWVDLDVIALRSLDFGSDYVFAYEDEVSINNAILRLPRTSPTLAELLKFTAETRGLPPHFAGLRRFRYWIRSFGRGLTIDRWPWASTGPRALTRFLKQTGEISHALPVSAFYTVPFEDARRFVVPGALALADLPADAWAVHLWGSNLRKVIDTEFGGKVPAGSFLDMTIRGSV
jgi:hypothetical protein